MVIKSLSILGLRGFATRQTIEFAIPNGKPGSGLTILVGANNAGKSTALEALRALTANQAISVTRGKRNEKAGDRIEISATSVSGQTFDLKSVTAGSSETVRSEHCPDWAKIFPVPSRRTFSPYFGRSEFHRNDYRGQQGLPATRVTSTDNFSSRLFRALKTQDEFNKILARVIDPVPVWTIDQEDSGNYFVKVRTRDATHSSEGAGEGFVSLLFLVDAFYDMSEVDMVTIDEPELSLHPAVQKRLAKLISEYAATNQIVVSTHSPYFVDIEALSVGGRIVRVVRGEQGSEFAPLSPETAGRLHSASTDMNNPHMMGLDAREVFFLDDHVILVEGQEDVMFLGNALNDVAATLKGTLFGWGAGGADKMELVARVLEELRFKKVAGILDADKAHLVPAFQKKFNGYHFAAISANDIRTKPAAKVRDAKAGLLDESNKTVRDEHREKFIAVISGANQYLSN